MSKAEQNWESLRMTIKGVKWGFKEGGVRDDNPALMALDYVLALMDEIEGKEEEPEEAPNEEST